MIYKTTSGGYIPDSQISSTSSIMNAGYSSCGISFFLAGTDSAINANWHDQAGPAK